MTTYYNINMIKGYPGGCCQFHYWSRLSSYSDYSETQMKELLSSPKMKTTKAKPSYRLGFDLTEQDWMCRSSQIQKASYLLGHINPSDFTQIMALTKDEWYKILAAHACINGGFLFLADNMSERGDVILTDLNIRDFASWLSRRARIYGRVKSVSKVTARKHMKCWIFSPHETHIYGRGIASTPQRDAIMEAGDILTETAERRLKGEL